jgi:hypothetical protein
LLKHDIGAGRLIPLLQEFAASPEKLLAYHSSGRMLPKKTTKFLAEMRGALAAASDPTASID